ncbi:MAG: RNA polymerase factor sigma-54 [Alloprevotella sp.]|nr:RNA polymerase factor sigma-54 [Alloprevotella sp.]
MPQRLEQIQREEQVQQLSTVQVAMAHLLELPLTGLEERVRNEMDANEALEEADTPDLPGDAVFEGAGESGNGQEAGDEMADYLTLDDVPDYLLRQQDGREEEREVQIMASEGNFDDLYRQMGEHDLSERERRVLEYIIGSLDDDGYLRKELFTLVDEMAVYQGIDTNEEEMARMLALLQTFEPRGIGARSLQECLRLQVDSLETQSPHKELALELLDRSWEDFAAHHWDIVKRRLRINQAQLEQVVALLTHMNPKPGSALGGTAATQAPTVVPDFYVSVDSSGIPSVQLNSGEVPDLRVSRAFRDTMREYGGIKDKSLTPKQQDELLYARKKVADAQLFIELVRRRRRTLLSVMHSIVQIQTDFFVNDDDEELLVPMKLKDVADRAGVDVSTVSRVAGGKYVQTAYGVYPLKHFFSLQFTAETGEELSSRHVKAALQDVVREEDKRKPLNDEAIALELKRRGYPISRRTVVKYRDQLGIPPSRLRKK